MNYEASCEALAARLGDFRPEVGLALGSGQSYFAEERLCDPVRIPYRDLPGFSRGLSKSVGEFVAGRVGQTQVLCLPSRLHVYDGYALDEITLPIRLMAKLGIRDLLLTNAAGGIRPELRSGDLMVIEDHINFLGVNPLCGPNLDAFGPRFPDMTETYCAAGRELMHAVAQEYGIPLQQGVYLATPGPSFETPAEIRAFRQLGADAVGMSSVPEVIVARHCGMRIMAISCITNVAAGFNVKPLSLEEVHETVARVKGPFANLLEGIVTGLSGSSPAGAGADADLDGCLLY